MAIQDSFGKIGFFEDFQRTIEDTDTTIADADGLMWNDILIVALSGDVTVNSTVDESGGVIAFSGAGGAADGVALLSSPMRPDRNGTIVVGGRCKNASAADFRFFGGWISTADRDETVMPFTLSTTTLTANNAGEAVGFYFDAAATTDDLRFTASSAGTADTAARVRVGDKVKGLTGQSTTTLGLLGVRAGATVTADKYFVWKVEMDPDGTVRGYVGDETMAYDKGLTLVATLEAGTMTTTSLYLPAFFMAATSTGDPLAEVDYYYAKGNRYWGA
jgi:hypothetical protein